MAIDSKVKIQLALIPGNAEALQDAANNTGNFGLLGVAQGIIAARNTLFLGVGVSALGVITFSESEGALSRYTALALMALGIGTTGIAGKNLYQNTELAEKCLEKPNS